MSKGKVVVGMSGGVDSSVTAYLLKQEGYEVIGATMQIWQDEPVEPEDGGCCGLSAVDDARRVANMLDIPYYVMNFKNEFKCTVIDYFVDEYLHGRTPNPCIACNRYVKWQALLNRSMEIGADYIATGHYAKIEVFPKTGRYTLRMSDAKAKDQTYVLYNLTQEQLKKTLMPIGEYNKDEVRKIAEEIGLRVANKPDSMEICFIPDDDYGKFIEENSDKKISQGNFVDMDGKILGRHKGIVYYTVGQRKGLGIAFGKPMFVYEIRPKTNEVVLCENSSLFKTTVRANRVNFMAFETIEGEVRFEAKIRYSHKKAPCIVRVIDEDTIECVFDEPQRAITPGQALVVYDGDYVVCGGTIY
ncbi:MAG: tRNA 2-thiouridine(34) synthase MnmA [Lachnospiraceae bacterium]|nr:tRNA 2-thiouridine(34) synthase MnmA [Lachnospiraceae bacterium]